MVIAPVEERLDRRGDDVVVGLAEVRVALEPAVGFTWAFPWTEALIALGVAFLAGVLACVLPAMRAAAHDPVQGLADE